MERKYNKIEHIELLKKKKSCEISEYDSQKCLDYSILTNCHLDWCIRENYLEILEDFQKGKINTVKFCVDINNIGNLTNDVIEIFESNFIILSPNKKALDFCDLLEEVFDLCEDYLVDLQFIDSTVNSSELEKYETEFKNSLEKIYLKIQNFLNFNV